MATNQRVTIKLKNPNPLFEKWITQWRDKAIEKDSKMQSCFKKALESLKKYPLPLESGRECKILKGFGEKLCKMLDDKLIEHKRNSNDKVQNKSAPTKKRESSSNEYVPQYHSGAYAILLTLYKKSLEPQYLGYMLKVDIIKEGKHLCNKSFVKPDPGSYYTAWSSMKTLLDKKLVMKHSSPAKYFLSENGVELAQKLRKTDINEVEMLPSTSGREHVPQSGIILKENTKNPSRKATKNKKEVPYSDDNLETASSSSASQDETFIFTPYSFEIILLVDTQEVPGSSKTNDDLLLDELTRLNVLHEIRHLKVGDYTWICRQSTTKQELILPYAIERKRMDDLASSIKDGRFHEQKFRLKQSGIENLIYLIESHGSNTHVGLPLSNLYQGATNTHIQDNFSIKFTADLKSTVYYLSTLTLILQKLYKSKTLVSCPKKNLNKCNVEDDLVSLMTFAEFNKNAAKSRNFKVRELFIRQLIQLKGLSVEKALAIVEKYPTPKVLYTAYQNTSETIGETLLSNLQFGTLNKKIGPAIMAKIDNILLKSKFRGCMLGALLGDCLGAPFEGETMTAGGKLILQKYFDKLEGPYFKAPIKNYTDDTAMTKSVAKSLIDKPSMDFKFLARLFVKEYFSEPKRGYGQNVVDVFAKLRRTKFEDVFKPAKEQFGGVGSYANGGAMRVSPLALYFHNNYEGMVDAVTKTTQITHTHKDAINGALLQSMAIQQCLKLDPVEKINLQEFTDNLIEKMKKIEIEDDEFEDDEGKPYQEKLIYMQQLLKTDPDSDLDDDVVRLLGNDISALGSVPTAIYCFLRAQSELPGIRTDNKFRRCIQYAISLGGDTDTIASMTGSLAGAYLGEEYISEYIIRHCEFQKEMLELADNLFTVL